MTRYVCGANIYVILNECEESFRPFCTNLFLPPSDEGGGPRSGGRRETYSIRRRHLISAKRNVITRSVYVIAWRMASPKVYVIDAPRRSASIVGDDAHIVPRADEGIRPYKISNTIKKHPFRSAFLINPIK